MFSRSTHTSLALIAFALIGYISFVPQSRTQVINPGITQSGAVSANDCVKWGPGTGQVQSTGAACASGTASLASAHIFVGNGSNVATDVALSQDCAMANTGAISCTKTNNVAFGSLATQSLDFLTLTADQNGTNVNTAQTWFPGGGATTYNALASTTYFVDGKIYITRTAGTTAHTVTVLFGGTATFTSAQIMCDGLNTNSADPNVLGAPRLSVPATGTVCTAASASATERLILRVNGVMRVNGAGTIIPQIQYSAAPGGTPVIQANTYFTFHAVGADTLASAGNWN